MMSLIDDDCMRFATSRSISHVAPPPVYDPIRKRARGGGEEQQPAGPFVPRSLLLPKFIINATTQPFSPFPPAERSTQRSTHSHTRTHNHL
jgi:hypothetical protein